MKSRLDQIEGKIKTLMEGNSSIFPWVDNRSSLIHKLLESIQECLEDLGDETGILPVQFLIYMNARDRQIFEKQEDWQLVVNNFITELAVELGYHVEKKIDLQLVTRQSLSRGEFQVDAITNSQLDGQTNAVPISPNKTEKFDDPPQCTSYLLMEDESLFPLEMPVTNIGRKSNNHLVINDLRVSRTHAQIRAVSDGFIIFDIGSSGGTYINGERISQRKLKPGDVISLAGIKLIFTEDLPATNENPRQITSELKPFAPIGNDLC
jgi:hypothetical protein